MLSNPRILVLDDSRDWVEYLQRTLQRHEFSVEVVKTAAEATRVLHTFPADVLVIDTETKDLDVAGMLRELRTGELHRDLPLLLLMPHGQSPDVDVDYRLSPCDFVTKPFKKGEFVTRVRALFRLKRLQDRVATSARRLQEELALARTVQRNLMPLPPPGRPGLKLDARYYPSAQLGGDFFDVVDLGGGSTGLFLADVVGHGVAASLFTSFLKAQLLHWSLQMQKDKPAETLVDMNQALAKTFAGSGRFVTALYATYQPGLERVVFANAGHPAPLRVPAEGPVELLEGAELPLGIDGQVRYITRSTPFYAGDRLYFFTDGLLEQRNADKQLFGKARLVEILEGARNQPLGHGLETLFQALREFGDGDDFEDDVNILAFECAPTWAST